MTKETGGAYFLALGGGNEIGRKCLVLVFPKERMMFIIDCGLKMLPKRDGKDSVAVPDLAPLTSILGPGWKVYLIITHAHTDHALYGPCLKKFIEGLGLKLVTITTEKTRALTWVMGEDGVKVREQQGLPAHYRKNELEEFVDSARSVRSSDWIDLGGKFMVRLVPAGHIQGAASVWIRTPYGIYCDSGDISFYDTTTVLGASLKTEDQVRWVSIDSTNGGEMLPDPAAVLNELVDSIARVIGRGGNALISSFAVGRGPDLAIALGRIFKTRGITPYSGGLLRKVVEVYYGNFWESDLRIEGDYHKDHRKEDVFNLKKENVFWLNGRNLDRFAYGRRRIAVVPSGMLEAGYSQPLFEAWAENPKNGIFIPGYQAEGTIGRAVLDCCHIEPDHRPHIDFVYPISGTKCSVKPRAEIKRFHFSGHGDGNQLSQWVSNMQPYDGVSLDKAILVHGNEHGQPALKAKLEALPNRPKKVLIGENLKKIML